MKNHPHTFVAVLASSRDNLRNGKVTKLGMPSMDGKKVEKQLRRNLEINHGWWGKIDRTTKHGTDCFKGFENIDGRLFPRNNL